MTTAELKETLTDAIDDWKIVVETPEGERYTIQGVRGDTAKGELVIEL